MVNNFIEKYLYTLGTSSDTIFSSSYTVPVKNLAIFLLFADTILYVGIVCTVFVTAARYNSEHHKLTNLVLKISQIICYASLVIIISETFFNFELLSFEPIYLFSGMYVFTASTQFAKVVVLSVALLVLAMFPKKFANNFRSLEVPLLMIITIALSVTMVSSSNLALLLLALEGFSLTLYIMTALGRTYGGITASVKYFGFGTLGSIFLFWGTVHLYSIIPSLSISTINFILNNSGQSGALSSALDFSTTAIVFGFMLKLGAAPTHQWVADTYAGVHMYITAYFSIFVKAVIFLLFFRLAIYFNYDSLLVQFSIISLFIGCFMSVNQTEIKRLLAYSSIVHVGFLLMGDGVASLVYLTTYLLSSVLVFAILLKSNVSGHELTYMNDLRFIRQSSIFNVFVLTIALASSAGLPPFAGFYGKFFIWSSLVEDIYLTNTFSAYLCLFSSIAITLITIFYYMRVIAYLFLQDDEKVGGIYVSFSAQDFYNFFLSLDGVLVVTIIFWSFLHTYVIKVAQLMCLFF